MNYQELDEYVFKYGTENKTGIDDMKTAMYVNKIRKEKERKQNGKTIRND